MKSVILIINSPQVLEKDCAGMRKEKDRMQNEILHLQLDFENAKDQLIEANAICETLGEERLKIEREFKRSTVWMYDNID